MHSGKIKNALIYAVLVIFAAAFIFPLIIVLLNSFKIKFSISETPFLLPSATTFAGIENYISGITDTGFLSAFMYSVIVTVFSVAFLVIFTSMAAWYIVRVKTVFTKCFYALLLLSMIVPFQMVMFTMSKTANVLRLDNIAGITVLYLGFGAGLSVFLFSGFIKSIPIAVEEAATIDGCNPLNMFFLVIFPMLKPISFTVAILNTMWIWNDYLLPYLIIGSDYKTIPIAVQYLKGGYGSIDMGSMMAVLVLAVIPVIVFYVTCQKYIIKGVAAGAVKG